MFWLSSVFYYQDNTVSNVSVQIHLYSFSSLDKLQEGEWVKDWYCHTSLLHEIDFDLKIF